MVGNGIDGSGESEGKPKTLKGSVDLRGTAESCDNPPLSWSLSDTFHFIQNDLIHC